MRGAGRASWEADGFLDKTGWCDAGDSLSGGQTWRKPDRSERQATGSIRLRHFPEQRITVYELAC
jgi:hypothetical protein